MIRVFVIDDEKPFRKLLKKELALKGFEVGAAADGKSALRELKKKSYDVILLDIVMPGMDGIAFMKKLKGDPAAPAIIVLSGMATIETAVEAMKNGAYDYLSKPYKLDDLEIIIGRAYEYGKLTRQSSMFRQELIRKESPSRILGSSKRFRNLMSLVRKIAPTDSTALIIGESGTGKELIANTIWHSSRSGMPFTVLNCAALSENIIESELFGHEKGAFTTAYHTKYGIVEVADRGTLLLDEIAEFPLQLQAKLLRFLDSGEFRRVGGNKSLNVDVRLIAATNKNLHEVVRQGGFREDLYYRLNVINIAVPPLRERKEDIPELAAHFIQKYSARLGKAVKRLSPEALEKMNAYDWPGNIRELENEIERAVILSDEEKIGPEDLSVPIAPQARPSPSDMLEDVEKEHITRVLRETGGNKSRASEILGINRKTLHLKLKKYGING
jgi:DNA-binding NtrC family response regulator